ncbi:Evi5 [Acrasis kona]|uniref:Evi5 n=1 Tax=Acrasis kona TaxID=1008807 RepID=A0AAW2YUE8_9EUKA
MSSPMPYTMSPSAMLETPDVASMLIEAPIDNRNKWMNMLNKWDSQPPQPLELYELVKEGIPCQKIRLKFWTRLLDCKDASSRFPGLFNKLSNSKQHDEETELYIKKDVHRTFPQFLLFASEDSPGQKAMTKILLAYAYYDDKVGYVQGMAFLAGFLYLTVYMSHHNLNTIDDVEHFYSSNPNPNLDEDTIHEATFWLFMQLFQHRKYSLKDVYRPGLPRLHLVTYMIDTLLRDSLPKVHQHLENQCLVPQAYISPFVIALFTNRFAYSTSALLFDMFLTDGWRVITRTMVGLIDYTKGMILKKNTAEIIPFLYSISATLTPKELLNVSTRVKLDDKTIHSYMALYEKSLPTVERNKIAEYRRSRRKIIAATRRSQIYTKVLDTLQL